MPANASVRSTDFVRELGLGGVLAVFIIMFTIANSNFFTQASWLNISVSASEYLLLGMAETLVILSAGIDLSVGAVVGLSGVVAAWLMQNTHSLGGAESIAIGLLGGVASGALVGLVNGILITYARMAPFIATLGTLGIASGLANVVSNGTPISGIPSSLGNFSNYVVGGWLPVPFLIGVVAVVWMSWLINTTRFGLHTRALGSNQRSARGSGVNHRKTLTRVYVISGVLSAIAGVLLAAEFTVGSPLTGATDELNAIAAVVIGGASLFGGKGNVRGTVMGAFLIAILITGLILAYVPPFWQEVAIGAVILGAVFFDQLRDRASAEL
jgi:ribose transport system permease protein